MFLYNKRASVATITLVALCILSTNSFAMNKQDILWIDYVDSLISDVTKGKTANLTTEQNLEIDAIYHEFQKDLTQEYAKRLKAMTRWHDSNLTKQQINNIIALKKAYRRPLTQAKEDHLSELRTQKKYNTRKRGIICKERIKSIRSNRMKSPRVKTRGINQILTV